MTFTPDHRALHPPHEQCDGCRTPAASAVGRDLSAGAAVSVPPPRTDLVFQLGSNRK